MIDWAGFGPNSICAATKQNLLGAIDECSVNFLMADVSLLVITT